MTRVDNPFTPVRRSALVDVGATCEIRIDGETLCGSPVVEGCPVHICHRHALEVFRHLSAIVDSARSFDAVGRVNATLATRPPRGRTADGEQWPALPDNMRGHRSVVYYARIGDHIKIGQTKRLVERMRWYPPSAVLLALEPGGREVELQRHAQFAHLRAARDEWFDPGPDLVDHMRVLALRGLPPAPTA